MPSVLERLDLYQYYASLYTTNSSTTYVTANTTYEHYALSTGGTPTVVANSPYVIDDWRTWNTGTSTTYTQNIWTATDTWREWNAYGANGGQTYQSGGSQYPLTLREPTPEELAQQEKARAKTVKAKVRAKSLLDSILTPEQRQYVERHGYIPVVGSKGRRYHIRTGGGASGNVVLVDEKEAVLGRFCAHPRATYDGHPLPTEDSFVAQVLHLQDDEDDFLGKANLVEGKNPVRRALSAVA